LTDILSNPLSLSRSLSLPLSLPLFRANHIILFSVGFPPTMVPFPQFAKIGFYLHDEQSMTRRQLEESAEVRNQHVPHLSLSFFLSFSLSLSLSLVLFTSKKKFFFTKSDQKTWSS
jgi:hypothetical protein